MLKQENFNIYQVKESEVLKLTSTVCFTLKKNGLLKFQITPMSAYISIKQC